MGTWGATAFENDSALDWLGGGASLKSVQSALAVIAAAPAKGTLDADDCAAALAAAECIAAARGHAHAKFPESARGALAKLRKGLTSADVKLAKTAVTRVLEKSELKDLWNKDKAFRDACHDLAERIGRRPVALPRFAPPKKLTPRVGDVLLIPLDDGSRGIAKIVWRSDKPPNPIVLGVYALRLARGKEPPGKLEAPFVELLNGAPAIGGPRGWPIVRNEPVLAGEIAAIAKTATLQPDRERKRVPAAHLQTLARALRVQKNADGSATVTLSPEGRERLESSYPLNGWIEKLVGHILDYAESS